MKLIQLIQRYLAPAHLLPKVLKSREAAEQLHTEDATLPCNSTRASAARGGPNGYPTTAADGDVF